MRVYLSGAITGVKHADKLFAKEFKVPKDFLFPDKKLVDITVKEPRADLALTDELMSKRSCYERRQ